VYRVKNEIDATTVPSADEHTSTETPEQPKRATTVKNARSVSPIDELETDVVLAAFRQVARFESSMTREELLKAVSEWLGYKG
jgi:hypothetical protein